VEGSVRCERSSKNANTSSADWSRRCLRVGRSKDFDRPASLLKFLKINRPRI